MPRLTVNINRECAAILRKAVAEQGVSVTEAIRRAVAWLAFVEKVTQRGDKIILVEEVE